MPRRPEAGWPVAVPVVAQVMVAVATLVVGLPGLLPGCVELELSTSIEEGKVRTLRDLAEAYNDEGRRVGGRCTEVSVHGTTSGLAMQALRDGWEDTIAGAGRPPRPEPQAWAPTSSMWLGLLRESGRVPGLPGEGEWESVTRSVLVVAMPERLAQALGEEQELTWERIGQLAESGWGAVGRDDLGEFTFGKDNPRLSTSGLAATVATFYAAAHTEGIALGDLGDYLDEGQIRHFVQRVEAGVHNYDDDIVDFLRNLARYDADGNALDYVSAVLLQEQMVYEYNTGAYSPDGSPPSERLVTFYPAESTLELDHPFVVLPSASDEQRQLAADFFAYLQLPESQEDLAEIGFRYGSGEAEPWTLDGDVATAIGGRQELDGSERVDPPPGRLVDQILRTWDDVRKPANILLVLDTSTSMRQPGAGGASRLQTMQAAVQAGIDQLLTGDHNVGVWSFPSHDPVTPHVDLVPVAPLDDAQRRDIREALGGLEAGGPTPVHRTVAAAYESLTDLSRSQAERGEREHINAVVVLTDGGNHDPDDPTGFTSDDLFASIDPQAGRPAIKVFTIGFDEEADFAFLDRLAEETQARAYDASDPARLEEIFLDVVQNF